MSKTQMAGEEAGGAVPLPAMGVAGSCRALVQMSQTSNVCRKLQLMSGGETCASPAGEPSGSPPTPCRPPRAGPGNSRPRQTRQLPSSPNPARKLARLEKNARRKMSRSRKRGKNEREKIKKKKIKKTNPKNPSNLLLERVVARPGPAGRAARRGGCGRGRGREAWRSKAVPPSPAQASKAARRGRPSYTAAPERVTNKRRGEGAASVRAGSAGGGDSPAPHPRQRGGERAALRSAVLIVPTACKRLGTCDSDRVCGAKQVTRGCCKCSRA